MRRNGTMKKKIRILKRCYQYLFETQPIISLDLGKNRPAYYNNFLFFHKKTVPIGVRTVKTNSNNQRRCMCFNLENFGETERHRTNGSSFNQFFAFGSNALYNHDLIKLEDTDEQRTKSLNGIKKSQGFMFYNMNVDGMTFLMIGLGRAITSSFSKITDPAILQNNVKYVKIGNLVLEVYGDYSLGPTTWDAHGQGVVYYSLASGADSKDAIEFVKDDPKCN